MSLCGFSGGGDFEGGMSLKWKKQCLVDGEFNLTGKWYLGNEQLNEECQRNKQSNKISH